MVHRYTLNGYHIVVDSNSGSIHWVDSVTSDMIGDYEKGDFSAYSEEEKKEILPEIEELIRRGKLFSRDLFEPMAKNLKNRQSVLKALCLHVAHACNMDCGYCFAGKGEYHGTQGLMSLETGKKALDFLVEQSQGRRNLEIDFFGGEPLLNWEVVKQIVAYGRANEKKWNKNLRFTITTNGLLLDREKIDFINREMSNVVLSLDGRKAVNDHMRRTKSGEGTHDLIVDKFRELVRRRGDKEYYIRGTYTRNNLDFSKDILYMADLGFKELSMEPVVAPEDTDYALRYEDLEQLKKEYEILALEMIKRKKAGNPFRFYHYTIDFEQGPCISKRISGCGVGTEYAAITPEGEIYPCHQFVGDSRFCLGDLDRGILKSQEQNLFKQTNVYAHEQCKDCFAKLYCSGGCAANAYHFDGQVNGIYEPGCILHRKRIECAIMMAIDESAS